MFGKYSEAAIEKINARLGTGHRVKPYDLTNVEDLKQALLVTVAAYRDYEYYKDSLVELSENYDESLEYCDTAAWLDLANAPDKVDDLIADGDAVLNAAADVFEKLSNRARKNCVRIVKAVLAAPPEVQKSVVGCAYNIKPKDAEAKIEELFEMLGEVEYHHAMPENLNAFLELMKEVWSDNR